MKNNTDIETGYIVLEILNSKYEPIGKTTEVDFIAYDMMLTQYAMERDPDLNYKYTVAQEATRAMTLDMVDTE